MSIKAVNRLYKFTPPGLFDRGSPGFGLPAAYQKFWVEWRETTPEPVHYIPEKGKYKRNPETGEVIPVQNVPIPLIFPKESNDHLWGGEGVVRGYQKRQHFKQRVPHFWTPILYKSVVYSEILNTYMSVMITDRVLTLIHKNYGFDHYILKTRACDLQSLLALKIKRKMLKALQAKDIGHDNPEKKEDVYCKYKDYLENYSAEEIDWYGLSFLEAIRKLEKEQTELNAPKPLKEQYRLDLVKQLMERGISADGDYSTSTEESGPSWLSKMNPFSGKK